MKKKELLFSVTKKDLKIDYYSGTGAGGQHRNRHMNSVRIKHPDSGVLVTCGDYKSKERNLKQAFKQLVEHPKFKKWHRMKTAEMLKTVEDKQREREEIEKAVDEQMKEENLKIEYYDPDNN
jgi:protein subunit release factor A